MSRISAVILTCESAADIEGCLESINWADEVVILDLESTDKTVDICRKHSCKLFTHPRVATAEFARNYGLAKATGDWILLLDADERPTSDLVTTLRKMASDPHSQDAYYILRATYMFGRAIHHSGWGADELIRFFKRGKCSWPPEIHSVPVVDGSVGRIARPDGYLIHNNYRSITHFIEKLNRYTSVEAIRVRRNQRPFHWIKLFFQPGREFYIRFIKLKGYRDGLAGLVLSLMMAYYWQLVYIKLWELEELTGKHGSELTDPVRATAQATSPDEKVTHTYRRERAPGFL